MNIAQAILLINNSGGSIPTPPPDPEQTSFYVSSSGSGTGDGTEVDPFTGLQFLNLVDSGLPGIPPNSTIYFNRGEFFPYQYDLDNGDISLSAYGTGDDPIIAGSDPTDDEGWTLDTDNTYYMSLAVEPKWIYGSDGQELKMAETDWIPITSRPSTTQVAAAQATLQALDGVEDLEGAYIICKEHSFRPCYRRTVTAYNGTTTLTLDAAPNTDASGAAAGMPFKLLNKRSYITDAGDWMYDATADRLYLKTSGGAPEGIRIATRDYGVKLGTGISNVSISGIHFEHQFLEGVFSDENHTVTVTNCNFSDLRTNAASFTGDGTGITYTFNTHSRIANNAVHIGAIDGGDFNDNTFEDIGMQDSISVPQYSYFRSVGCGIHMRWDDTGTIWVPQNITCLRNQFDNMAYCPIVVVGIGHNVQNNRIDLFGQRWADCGGVYVSNVYGTIYGNGSDTYNCTVSNNTIVNGTPSSLTLEGITGGSTVLMGIYIDNNCSYVTMEDNYIDTMNHSGIHINWSNLAHIMRRNRIYNCGDACIQFIKWEGSNSATQLHVTNDEHIMEDNYLVAKSVTQACLKIYSVDNDSYNPFGNGGGADNNTYVHPYKNDCIIIDFSSEVDYTLASWQALFSEDAASETIFTDHLWVDATKASIDTVSAYNFTASPTTLTPDADYYYVDENGDHDTDFTVPAWGGKVVIRTHRPRITTVVDDTYTGSAGNLTGHTPDVGSAWTIQSGTFALDGSGNLTSSVAGNILQTCPGADCEIETTGQVSATGGLNIRFRFIGNSDCILVQLLINSAANEQLNVLNDGATVLTLNPGTLSLNTDYKLRARIEGGTCSVWLNDVLRIEIMDNATLKASNPSTVVHGINIGTVARHNRTTIWSL